MRVHEPGPPAERAPDPAPAPRRVPHLEVVPGIPALTGRPAPSSRRIHRPFLFLVGALLLLALAGSPLVPEVIRIPLPERWRWRLPRVEFVRHDRDEPAPSLDTPATELATSLPDVSVPVPPASVPAPVESTTTATLDSPGGSAIDDSAANDAKAGDENSPEPPADPKRAAESSSPGETRAKKSATRSIVSERAAAARPTRPAAKQTATRTHASRGYPEPEPEPPVIPGGEGPGTIIPSTRVITTVQAAPPPAKPAPAPAPPQAAESEEDWPLLCGTVLDDATGTPIEGARVALPANALTVRTDRRGRFCVACPPGSQPVRVEAAGHQPAGRTVELATGMVEIRIALTRSP
jgi:hypothetical protein